MDIRKILSEVPHYESFFTMDEMDASTHRLAADYPELVTVTELGRSRKGRPLYCIKIGDYEKNAFAFASPHPNEPIGSTMLEFLTRKLCEDKDFRDELGFTWYIIKSVDPDGTVLNEGWFKGPYNIHNYAANFFRPAGFEQSEWSFPYEYKTYKFDNPTPETRCIMKVIDEVKPEFMYSLHNAGFGGVYWYISDDLKGAYPDLWTLVDELELPLRLGEPETPYAVPFDKAVYKQSDTPQKYEYYAKTTGKDPAASMTGGAGSFDYLRQRVPDAFTLVCEAPYFFNPAIGDLSESSVIRRDSVLASCDITEGIHNFMRPRFDQIRDLVAPDNNLATAVRALVDRNPGSESKRIWAKTTPECQVPATVAQVFTNGPIARFYAMLGIGMLARAARMEADSGRHTPEQVELLRRVDAEASAELQRQCDIINSEIEYQVVPIWKLVTMQLASALYFIRELKK